MKYFTKTILITAVLVVFAGVFYLIADKTHLLVSVLLTAITVGLVVMIGSLSSEKIKEEDYYEPDKNLFL